jgi:peptide/nickel transport system substrate-binding protein
MLGTCRNPTHKHDKEGIPMRIRQVIRPAAAALTIAAVVAGSVTAAAFGSSAALNTMTIRALQDWTTFDAMVDAGRGTNFAFIAPGYDHLVSYSAKGAKDIVPYIATSWTQKAKFITFTLRRDAKCSDGHVLTAVDVLNSVKRWIQVPKRTGAVSATVVGGFGPGPYHLHANNKKSTFTLSLDSPYRNLLGLFAALPIICPSGLQQLTSDPKWLETHIAGSGPYELVSATHNDKVVWKVRPEWKWGPPGATTGANLPQNLVYQIVTDETTAANLLLTGGVDSGIVTGSDVDRLVSNGSLNHYVVPNYLITQLWFNQRPGRLFEDEKLREAVMTAIDINKANQAAYDGRGTPTTSVFRPDGECYDPKTKQLFPKTDVDRAKQILDDDGWRLQGGKRVKGGQTLSARFVGSQSLNNLPEYVFTVLNDLGFDLDFANLPSSTYGANVLAGNFDIALSRGTTVLPEAGAGLSPFSGPPPPQGQNSSAAGYGDALLQRLENAGFQNPGQGGCKYFALYQERLIQKHYLMPLVAVNFDLFSRKPITIPPVQPDQVPFPIYFVKTG